MATTRCAICGNPCKAWSVYDHSACQRCAGDIYARRNPGAPARNCEDGFAKNSSWEEYVHAAKKEWLRTHTAACYCCGKNCKDWSSGGAYVSLCASCTDKVYIIYTGNSDDVSAKDGNGFPLNRDNALNKIKQEYNSVKIETKKVVEDTMKIETWDLIEGDRVRLRINDCDADDGFVEVDGTFLARGNDGMAMIALDEEYHSGEYDSQNWYDQPVDGDNLRALARKYGVKDVDNDNVWTVEDSSSCETKITKVLKHQAAKEDKRMPLDTSSGREISWGATFAKDSGKAAIRSGATLGIDGLKEGISKMLTSQGMNGPGVQAVLQFFSTDIGDAMLRAGLGYTLLGLPIPYIQENEYAQSISEELRVSGLSGGMDQGIAMVKQFIAPALMEAFKNTPIMKGIEESANKARVAEGVAPQRIATPAPLPQAGEEIEIEADPFANAKRAVA